jgi:hypothetical protein
MERDMQRLQFVRQQIKAIEQNRFERLKEDSNTRLNMMVLLVARVSVWASRPQICSPTKSCHAICETDEPWLVMPVLPGRWTKAEPGVGRKVWHELATRGCAAA